MCKSNAPLPTPTRILLRRGLASLRLPFARFPASTVFLVLSLHRGELSFPTFTLEHWKRSFSCSLAKFPCHVPYVHYVPYVSRSLNRYGSRASRGSRIKNHRSGFTTRPVLSDIRRDKFFPYRLVIYLKGKDSSAAAPMSNSETCAPGFPWHPVCKMQTTSNVKPRVIEDELFHSAKRRDTLMAEKGKRLRFPL